MTKDTNAGPAGLDFSAFPEIFAMSAKMVSSAASAWFELTNSQITFMADLTASHHANVIGHVEQLNRMICEFAAVPVSFLSSNSAEPGTETAPTSQSERPPSP